ncbi:hypothetical protein OG271_15050 [Micromonospora rifamycinica]|uniref:hypothetical protein n=1 Tax=Micromonospora rifamycinica TaxID=291594 RepID=UPI002E2A02CA|nr:hypothetical protein [Micromonospora rifamycinica]
MTFRTARILVVALTLAGCATPAPHPQKRAEPFPPTEQVEGLRLPFDAYTLSLSGLYTVANAQDLLTRECMAARGEAWEIIERPTDLADLRNRRRYGVIEPGIAEHFGYHVPEGLLTPGDIEQRYDARDRVLSETQTAALSGAGGCTAEAVTRLRPARKPDRKVDQGLVERLSQQSLVDSQGRPEVKQALGKWRDCLREWGFSYPGPFAAMSDSAWWTTEAAPPSESERAVAVADVRCKERTGLVARWYVAETALQQAEIRRRPAYFQALGLGLADELAAAEAVSPPGR